MSAYVYKMLDQLIEDFEGKAVDVTGVHGAQSPDLVQVFVSRLLGREWPFPYAYAAQLWADEGDLMPPRFERVERGEPMQPGDVTVFDGVNGYGTVGIYVSPGSLSPLTIDVFTQTPGPASVRIIDTDGPYQKLLGAWRFTAGADCVALADQYARTHVESLKPGDVVGNTRVVRVERTDEELPSQRLYISRPRGHGKTALLAKLKELFGGKP